MIFDIDANGILNVTAKDKGTGKEQKIRIEASSGLTDADIERMVKDAEANATADKQRREQVEARNQTEAMVHQVEKDLKEHGDKLPAETKTEVEAAMAGARSALDGQDAAALKSASDRLTQSAMKIGEAVYKAQSDAAAPGPDAAGPAGQQPGGRPGDNVVDADFEEVDPKKKAS